jgi:hypothetical protein
MSVHVWCTALLDADVSPNSPDGGHKALDQLYDPARSGGATPAAPRSPHGRGSDVHDGEGPIMDDDRRVSPDESSFNYSAQPAAQPHRQADEPRRNSLQGMRPTAGADGARRAGAEWPSAPGVAGAQVMLPSPAQAIPRASAGPAREGASCRRVPPSSAFDLPCPFARRIKSPIIRGTPVNAARCVLPLHAADAPQCAALRAHPAYLPSTPADGLPVAVAASRPTRLRSLPTRVPRALSPRRSCPSSRWARASVAHSAHPGLLRVRRR